MIASADPLPIDVSPPDALGVPAEALAALADLLLDFADAQPDDTTCREAAL